MTRDQKTNPLAEKALDYGFKFILALSLAVGGWYFSRVGDTMEALTKAVSELKTDIAVMKVQNQDVSKLKDSIIFLQKDQTESLLQIRELTFKIRDLEDKLKK